MGIIQHNNVLMSSNVLFEALPFTSLPVNKEFHSDPEIRNFNFVKIVKPNTTMLIY